MGKLFIMCGWPASGKSTFINKYVAEKTNAVVISRDKIRFSLLKEGDEYFKYEPIVEEMFYMGISKALALGFDVFADQSSISVAARRKLINRVSGYTEINAIWVYAPIEDCIARDVAREGRARVGETVIRNMAEKFVEPSFQEKFSNIYKYSTNENLLFITRKDDNN